MKQQNALAELESRVQAMDALPRSFDVLRQAIETIAAGVSADVTIQIDGQYLRARRDHGSWNHPAG
jgi:hypothetical protein